MDLEVTNIIQLKLLSGSQDSLGLCSWINDSSVYNTVELIFCHPADTNQAH